MSWQHFLGEGRLCQDPNLETISNGTHLLNVNMAFTTGWGKSKKTCYFQVTIWGKMAKFVSDNFHKGDGMFIRGRVDQERWIDKVSAEKKSKHKLTALEVNFPTQNKAREEPDMSGFDDGPPSWNTPTDPDEIPL